MKSSRVAPFNASGDEVHLRNEMQCLEKSFQEDVGVSPPFDWSWAIVVRDSKTDSWKKLDKTFDNFLDAQDRFRTLAKNKHTDLEIGNLMIDADENSKYGRRPTL